ncbi:aspartic peptidase [Lactarius tabidus]
MFPITSLTVFLILAVIARSKIIGECLHVFSSAWLRTLSSSAILWPVVRHLNITGAQDVVLKDQACAENLVFLSKASSASPDTIVSVGAANVGVVYQASIGVGTHPQSVGAGKAHVKTSSSLKTGNHVSSTLYPYPHILGTEYSDTVTISSELILTELGPVDLTVGTMSPGTDSPIPAVIDNLFSQGYILSDLISVSFEPTTSSPDQNGELTFGGTYSIKFTGSITYVEARVVTSSNISVLTRNWTALLRQLTLPTSTTGVSTSPPNRALLKPSAADVHGRRHFLTVNAQIWPLSLNSLVGGTLGDIYLVVNDIGSSGSGLDFINGYTSLERLYSLQCFILRMVTLDLLRPRSLA